MVPFFRPSGYSYVQRSLNPVHPSHSSSITRSSLFRSPLRLPTPSDLQIPLILITHMLCYTTAWSFPIPLSSIFSSAGCAKVGAVCIDASTHKASSFSSSSRARFCGSSGVNETNLNEIKRKSVRSMNCSVGLGDFGEVGQYVYVTASQSSGILEPKRVTHSVNLPAASRSAISSVQAYSKRLGFLDDVERWAVSRTIGIERFCRRWDKGINMSTKNL